MPRRCAGPCVGRVRAEVGGARHPEFMADSILPGVPVVSIQGDEWLEVVNRQVEALRFGSVQITIHEGRVVQVETSTKVRFDKPR